VPAAGPDPGEQVEGEPPVLDAVPVTGAGPAGLRADGGAQQLDLPSQPGRRGPGARGPDRRGALEQAADLRAGAEAGRVQDEAGGLEPDGEGIGEGHGQGGGDAGGGALGGSLEVTGGEQRPRQHGPDQRHFPFDA
jgi:hypothetical protein